jgi:hypothetical protein
MSEWELHQGVANGIPHSKRMLEGFIARLEEKKQQLSRRAALSPSPPGRTVFLVHGRDQANRETVARFLGHLGLHVIVLHERPDRGRTLIETL